MAHRWGRNLAGTDVVSRVNLLLFEGLNLTGFKIGPLLDQALAQLSKLLIEIKCSLILRDSKKAFLGEDGAVLSVFLVFFSSFAWDQAQIQAFFAWKVSLLLLSVMHLNYELL